MFASMAIGIYIHEVKHSKVNRLARIQGPMLRINFKLFWRRKAFTQCLTVVKLH